MKENSRFLIIVVSINLAILCLFVGMDCAMTNSESVEVRFANLTHTLTPDEMTTLSMLIEQMAFDDVPAVTVEDYFDAETVPPGAEFSFHFYSDAEQREVISLLSPLDMNEKTILRTRTDQDEEDVLVFSDENAIAGYNRLYGFAESLMYPQLMAYKFTGESEWQEISYFDGETIVLLTEENKQAVLEGLADVMKNSTEKEPIGWSIPAAPLALDRLYNTGVCLLRLSTNDGSFYAFLFQYKTEEQPAGIYLCDAQRAIVIRYDISDDRMDAFASLYKTLTGLER